MSLIKGVKQLMIYSISIYANDELITTLDFNSENQANHEYNCLYHRYNKLDNNIVTLTINQIEV